MEPGRSTALFTTTSQQMSHLRGMEFQCCQNVNSFQINLTVYSGLVTTKQISYKSIFALDSEQGGGGGLKRLQRPSLAD